MGGQGIERREILRYIGIASVAGSFPGFSKWTFACAQEHVHESGTANAPKAASGPYKPLFFSTEHFRMIEHLSEMIIPADDTPGAKEAGVAEFIDFMVANRVAVSSNREVRNTGDALAAGDEAQTRWLAGLDWMNARALAQCGHGFMECSAAQQASLLEELAYKAKFKPTTESGRVFFQFLRDYVVVGYYTTKIGLESLGYPGLRAVWPSMPGCSHTNDPEHVNLPKPTEPRSAEVKSAGGAI
jgi:gluconate 2-dehydrogenase gamma chain